MSYSKGLHDVGDGLYAYLQPDGGWGWSNAGLVADGEETLLIDTLFDLDLTEQMLSEMRHAVPAASRIDTLVNTHANGDHCYGNELVADAQVLELAANTGVRCHIVHSTVAAGNRIARYYREQGAKISFETCVHYFVFNDHDALRQGAFLKLNPPLRSETERLALWDSLAAGEIDFVSTDHVAWPISRKSDPDMAKNGSGIPGLETLLPAFYTAAVRDHGFAPEFLARMIAENPARHFGLYPRKGVLAPGELDARLGG